MEKKIILQNKRMKFGSYSKTCRCFVSVNKVIYVHDKYHIERKIIFFINFFYVQGLLYSGLLEELVELLEMKGDHLMEIKAGLAIKKPTQKTHPKKP
jgi:hypothetical protein